MPEPALAGARVLVTGATGFTGRYAMAALSRAGASPVPLSRRCQEPGGLAVDLTDADQVALPLAGQSFDFVLHLAGSAFAGDSAEQLYAANLLGTRHLLAALVRCAVRPRLVVVASSASVYGPVGSQPVREDAPTLPQTDYGISKLAAEGICRLFGQDLPILVVRPFNYTGVGQDRRFAVARLVAHFRDRTPEFAMGRLDVRREFNDVRAVAKVYVSLLCAGRAGQTVNLASGQAHSLLQLTGRLQALSGHQPRISCDPSLLRAADVQELRGDATVLQEMVGPLEWPSLDDTLSWMLRGDTGQPLGDPAGA